jgi:hypothetical protein
LGEAEVAYVEAYSIFCGLLLAGKSSYLPAIAATANNLANLYYATRRPQKAEMMHHLALDIRGRLAEVNRDAFLPAVAKSLSNLAALYKSTERISEAEQVLLQAHAVHLDLAKTNPDAYMFEVASGLVCLGVLYVAKESFPEAEHNYIKALAIYRDLAKGYPDVYLPSVAMLLSNMAHLYAVTEQTEVAKSFGREAEQVLDPFWQANRPLHGDQMAKILSLQAGLAMDLAGLAIDDVESNSEARLLASRALAAAYEPDLKQRIRNLLDVLSPESEN